MGYNVIFKSEKLIHKDLSKIPLSDRKKIFFVLKDMKNLSDMKFNVKQLKNYYLCDYRIRVWNYRILFDIRDDNTIVIYRILHRSKLY